MLTNGQRIKILAIYDGAEEKICDILRHFKVVKNMEFETSIFLFAIAGVSFGEHSGEIAEIIGGETLLYSLESEGNKAVTRRLALYGKVADNRFSPCAFWSPISVECLFGKTIAQSIVLFGDFLVYPECATNYLSCLWPPLRLSDIAVFSYLFVARIFPEVFAFIHSIAEVINEEA